MYRKRISHIIGLSGALLALIFVVSLTYSVAADSSVNNSNIPTHAPTTGGAFIDNGTVQLGIHDEGHLNVGGGPPSSGTGTTFVGLRYLPTGAEATAPGCLCEGWGAADAISGVTGYANEAIDGVVNIGIVSAVFTPSTAFIVSNIGGVLEVTHDYHPSPATPFLYEVTVTIENTSAATVDPRYRRVMDWDIEPTAFNEFVTLDTGTAANIIYASDNGFETANPLGSQSALLFGGVPPVVEYDNGPADHGALWDFDFDDLAPGESVTFNTYYGAAGTETDALGALAAVSAEAFSLGQCYSSLNSTCSRFTGTPNTFIFAFSGVGGDPILPACTLDPVMDTNPPGTDHTVTATVTDGGNPAPGVMVDFNVVSGPNTGDNGSDVTDGAGEADFTYTGDGGLGTDTIVASGAISGIPFECTATKTWEEVTAVVVDDFSATVAADGSVMLSWLTSGEINHAGFNVYRSTSAVWDAATATKINADLIAAQGGASGGSYSFSDMPAVGVYTYFLESVATDGTTVIEASAEAVTQAPTSAGLTGLAGNGNNMALPLLVVGLLALGLIAFAATNRRHAE
ncbi:MAG: hypothetical protein M9928_01985 [Anaerolineae bacterium]|nr:hypothetical protein [Anaerolineae bacterium]MCO5188231.1 hypothetical protein [Anaerolineae bacterium]MCO5192297.1 hypothetical protein [Anaerolineae bacterium]MCO5197603.1 hypothetical protein [Anaerolineae bacterium]MCO5203775.1 hypothetical protein [Anaerolineae bacterium]